MFSAKKVAIFCDSTFWHGHDWEHRESRIKSNRDYWINKIERNIERDRKTNEKLKELGWHVIRFWDFEINKDLNRCVDEVAELLERINKKC